MSAQTWISLASEFKRFPHLRAEAATDDDIHNAVGALGGLPADYVRFLRTYGSGIVGPFKIFGVRKAEAMGSRSWSVVEMTRHFRKTGWPAVERWVIVSMDHGGNPIGLGEDGAVYTFEHETRVVRRLAAHFEEFLERCLAETQRA